MPSTTTSESDTIYTPTSTIRDDSSTRSSSPYRCLLTSDNTTVPWQERTYMIRHRSSTNVLTLIDGTITLQNDIANNGGWRWQCIEREGWLGFRESVSGHYLGRDNAGGFRARATRHEAWEAFVVRPHPEGGHQLLTCHWWQLRPIAVTDSGKLYEAKTSDQGALWEFVEI
ncbi:hypothetical protein F5Y16DRAFT_370028 [Xylariaceae sp. FL0255]|nr:hypothetical protein F5Y16DRAFT_370028 [Xylariaceae sp. FL0255]